MASRTSSSSRRSGDPDQAPFPVVGASSCGQRQADVYPVGVTSCQCRIRTSNVHGTTAPFRRPHVQEPLGVACAGHARRTRPAPGGTGRLRPEREGAPGHPIRRPQIRASKGSTRPLRRSPASAASEYAVTNPASMGRRVGPPRNLPDSSMTARRLFAPSLRRHSFGSRGSNPFSRAQSAHPAPPSRRSGPGLD